MEYMHVDELLGQSSGGEVYVLGMVSPDGCTGTIYRPVYREEYEAGTSVEGLQRHLRRWWEDARRRGDVRGIGEYASDLYTEKGEGVIWDVASESETLRLRGFTGLGELEVPIFSCCGGGRCIERDISWSKVVDPYMLFNVLELEAGRLGAWDYFVKRGR